MDFSSQLDSRDSSNSLCTCPLPLPDLCKWNNPVYIWGLVILPFCSAVSTQKVWVCICTCLTVLCNISLSLTVRSRDFEEQCFFFLLNFVSFFFFFLTRILSVFVMATPKSLLSHPSKPQEVHFQYFLTKRNLSEADFKEY